jgi:molecular chaperone GrpE
VSQQSRTPSPQDPTRAPESEQTGTHELLAGMDEARPLGVEPIDGNGSGTAHGAELEALRKELAVAEENSRAQRELYLRAAAEIDNVRKRAQRDIEQAHRYAIESFANELLAVRDSLELALHNGATADAATLLEGEEATLKLLDRAFAKFSIRKIDPVGQRFDPNQHEAMLMQESAGAAPNTVLQVVQSGYELNGRLLRPARVIVARAAGEGPAGGA